MTSAGDWRMTIGAQPGPDGVTFRVWAPTSERVDVVLYRPSEESVHALRREEGGYFSGIISEAGPGSRYRFRLDGDAAFPDPASRHQPDSVHGPSEVVDPLSYEWRSVDWDGRSLDELVIYEMHVGTFTGAGTFDAAIERLNAIADLGVTAVEPMPIANFPGARNWGYDGVNLFAPATAYGGYDGFKRFVDAAHELGLAVILDVVYNHFGPEGNYIPAVTGGRFFTDRHATPWGAGIDYDGPESAPVRDFILQNALHWLCEYRVDGLRLDATHAIIDDSETHILAELAMKVREIPGPPRLLIAEDERNERRLLLPSHQGGFGLDAVWADDLHHQIRRLTAGDHEGYFARYSGTMPDVATTLEEGWWRNGDAGRDRTLDGTDGGSGTRGSDLVPTRFIHCIQNHDQVGNRAFGDRLNQQIPPAYYRAISVLLIMSPYTPLLWMGQEWAASTPFQFFTDFPHDLGWLVTQGRRKEFQHFAAFRDKGASEAIPDPQAVETFERSKLRWDERNEMEHAGIEGMYRELLHLRRAHPALANRKRGSFGVEAMGEGALALRRTDPTGAALLVVVALGEIKLELDEHPLTRCAGGRNWSHLLSTEERRFGGDGGWGRIEADGVLHLVQPGGVVLGEAVG